MIDPQDSTSLEGNAPRGRILNGDSNLLHKRDRSPPISEEYSSLSLEAKLARAESVLRAVMAEGCPSNEGMTVETVVKYVDLNSAGCRQTAYKRPPRLFVSAKGETIPKGIPLRNGVTD